MKKKLIEVAKELGPKIQIQPSSSLSPLPKKMISPLLPRAPEKKEDSDSQSHL
jgi:hypothetical protein